VIHEAGHGGTVLDKHHYPKKGRERRKQDNETKNGAVGRNERELTGGVFSRNSNFEPTRFCFICGKIWQSHCGLRIVSNVQTQQSTRHIHKRDLPSETMACPVEFIARAKAHDEADALATTWFLPEPSL
jgi:hypothetical protein